MLAPYVNKCLNKRSTMDVKETIEPKLRGEAISSVHGAKTIKLQSIDLSQYYDSNLINKKKRITHSVESGKSKTNRNSSLLKSINGDYDGKSMISRYNNNSKH